MFAAFLLTALAPRSGVEPVRVPMCELLRRPSRYEGAVVAIEAVRIPDVEMEILSGLSCLQTRHLVVGASQHPESDLSLRWQLKAGGMSGRGRFYGSVATYTGRVRLVRRNRRVALILLDLMEVARYRIVRLMPSGRRSKSR